MDLHIVGGEPTHEERAAVDALLGPPDSGWEGGSRDMARDGRVARGGHAARARRADLLPAFHAVQDRVGWVSRGAMNYICRRLTVPPAEAWGVLTFYHLLAHEPRARAVAHVCDDIACRLRGAQALCADLERQMGPAGQGADRTWLPSPCLGRCEQAPAVLVTRAGAPVSRTEHAPVSGAEAVVGLVSGAAGDGGGMADLAALRRSVPQAGRPGLRLLRRVGAVDPTSLEAYRASGGYRALARAVEIGPERVIAEVAASKLVGRGGAAFPTGRKWDAVRRQPARPHYVVCNADESEPGTFKDRLLMTGDPFAIVEALTICGFATGAEHGFVYVRGEYPAAEAALARAIEQARRAGLLGADVAGAGFAFDLEIRRGAGAYICGEETALFNSIEGKRGEPRAKPPFPAEAGLFGKPTVVNNVETLANVPDIVLEGGQAWARAGTEASTGTRLWCLSGHVATPGLYELPFGATLRDVIAEGGGVAGGRPLQAVLLGGAAGTFVGPDALDMPLTFEGARAAGATLGSGVVMVFDDSADLVDTLARIAAFFVDESCGQCVPCRVGTVRQAEVLDRLRAARRRSVSGGASAGELALLTELGQAMRDASICGLGQTASAALESALARLHVFQPGGAP
ncbi:MAG: NAD(P)H-dependent oxidoreductase subunit E [Acidobacteriota bacterium]